MSCSPLSLSSSLSLSAGPALRSSKGAAENVEADWGGLEKAREVKLVVLACSDTAGVTLRIERRGTWEGRT